MEFTGEVPGLSCVGIVITDLISTIVLGFFFKFFSSSWVSLGSVAYLGFSSIDSSHQVADMKLSNVLTFITCVSVEQVAMFPIPFFISVT